jgi:hypothetical protein
MDCRVVGDAIADFVVDAIARGWLAVDERYVQ